MNTVVCALFLVLCSWSVEAQYSYGPYTGGDPNALSLSLYPYPGPNNWVRINLTTFENIRAFSLHFSGPAVITGASFGNDFGYSSTESFFELNHDQKTIWGSSSDSSIMNVIPLATYGDFLRINFTDCSGCKVCLEPSSTFFGLDSQILTSNTHKEVNLCTSLGEEEYSDFVVPDFQRPALKGSIDVRIFYRVWVMDDGIGVSIRAHNQKSIGAFQFKQTSGPAPVDRRPGLSLDAHDFSLFSANGNTVGMSFRGNSLPEAGDSDTELVVMKFPTSSFQEKVCLGDFVFSDSSGTVDLTHEYLQGECLWLVEKTPFSYYDLPEVKYKNCAKNKNEINFEASNIYPHFLVSLQGRRQANNPNKVIILSTEEGDGIAENVNSPGVLCEEVETGLTLIEKSKKRWVPDDGKLNNQKFNQENKNCNQYWYQNFMQVIDMETCAPSRLLRNGEEQVNPPMPNTPLTPLTIEDAQCNEASGTFQVSVSGASQLKNVLLFTSFGEGSSPVTISQALIDEINLWPSEFLTINPGMCEGVTLDLTSDNNIEELGVAVRLSKTVGTARVTWPISQGCTQMKLQAVDTSTCEKSGVFETNF